MSDDKKGTTDLSPAGAGDYAKRIAAAKQGKTPIGGVEMPSMPRLDQPPPGAPADRHMGVQQAHTQQARMQKAMTPEQYQKAVEEGQVRDGVGGAYYANQPPPMEKTSQDGPVNPPKPGGGLSQETVAGLEAVAEANQAEEDEESEELDDEEYFSELGEATKDIIQNKQRRKAIEEKIVDELNFEDLILHQELRQEVPILKGFRPTYRTPTAQEDLFVKRLIGQESGSDRYVIDKYTIMNLCCGLFMLNKKPLPSHLDNNGRPDEKLFQAKLDFILKYPVVLIADLSANFVWFQERVQTLLAIDKVKDF